MIKIITKNISTKKKYIIAKKEDDKCVNNATSPQQMKSLTLFA
jgi:hypothetical protein